MNDRRLHLHFVTNAYVELKQLFIDLGIDVPEQDDGWQIVPAYNRGRGCIITFGDLFFCLEERTHSDPSGPLFLDIGDIPATRLLFLKERYSVEELGSGFSNTNHFRIVPPGGGAIEFTADS